MESTHSKIGKAKSASIETLNCEAPDFVGSTERVPDGFVRRSDLSKKWKVKDSTVSYRLRDLISAGKVIAKKFYVKRCAHGHPDYITHYKLL